MELKTIRPMETLLLESDKLIYKTNIFVSNRFDIAKLKKISILTSNQGPISDDVALALFFDTIVLILPSEHKNFKVFLFDKISKSFKINYNEIIKAMSCVENAEFVLWSL